MNKVKGKGNRVLAVLCLFAIALALLPSSPYATRLVHR